VGIVASKVRKGERVEMEIPNVGVLVVRNGIAGVEFLEYLIKETEEICSKPVEERMAKGEMALTKERV